MDKKQYTGWLTSPDIVKRSFAVMGHYFLAYLILAIGFLAVAFVIGILGAILDLF